MDNSLSVYEVQILNTNTGCLDVFLVTAISITFAYINFSEIFEEDFHDDGNVKVVKLEEF
ncbi:hypothetical protein QOFMPA_00014 [Enterococcus phage vB_OCPT_Toy]|nr:hypothetical protein QOFMPA_00014 [Enterococcus phage vB_OCPT_Toy]